jgi:hypothetical protein
MKKILNFSFFLIRTTYFSPINNPIFFCIIILAVFLFFCGDLGKHESVMFILISSISHRLMPSLRLPGTDSIQCTTNQFVRSISLLPIKNEIFLASFLLSGIVYISLQISFFFLVGISYEKPPTIKSICPTKLKFVKNNNGEVFTNLEGITFDLRYFQIPIVPSLFFGNLASNISISQTQAADSIMQRLCPLRVTNPEELFSGVSSNRSVEEFSPILIRINNDNFIRLLYLSIFCFAFFLFDGISIFYSRPKLNDALSIIGSLVDVVIRIFFAMLCIVLLLDILLPEYLIAKVSPFLSIDRKIFIPIFAMTTIVCLVLTLVRAVAALKPKIRRN